MIVIIAHRHDGHVSITCNGHAASDVCRAASMIMQAAALGLEDLAKQYPKDVAFFGFAAGEHRYAFSSDDRRKDTRRKRTTRLKR